MFGLFQNIIVMLFSVFFSLFSALFGFLEDGGGILDWNTPEMSLYTQSSQGDGTAVELSGYGGENPQDPAFLKELLNEYQPETFSAEAGERAEVQMRQDAGVYSVGWGDHPADVALWKIAADGSLSETEANDVSASIRFGVLQLSFTMPEEDGNYLLTVRENYNIGPVLHLVHFNIGDVEEPAVTDNGYIPPQTYDYGRARELGYVVVTDDGVENAAALDRFIEDWEDGKDSSIYLIKEGKQGKPLATLFLSRNGRLIAYNDYTQIGGEVFQKEYADIGVFSEEGKFSYYVTDWEGESYFLFERGTGTQLKEEEYGGTIVASTPHEDGITYMIYGFRTGSEGEKSYINVFADNRTKIVRSGNETQIDALQLGDDVAVVTDPAYMPQTPNTVRAEVIWAVPSGAAA